MKKILLNQKAITKNSKKQLKKLAKQEQNKILKSKPSKLERTPATDFYDFSREEEGIFMIRDRKGNLLKVINLIFPR